MTPLHTLLEPPDGQRGEFAWICGYDADADALDRIAEGFTRLMGSQRAHEGRTWLGLFLDRGSDWILPGACPGVAHLRLSNQPWKLLHAKLALASFVGPDDVWTIRLVVCTGNWTRQTLEDSLDLAWTVQLDDTDLVGLSESTRAACRDVLAAADVFDTLREQADLRVLGPGLGPVAELSRQSMLGLDAKLQQLGPIAGRARAPHVIDNRRRSLKNELLGRLKARNAKRLNTLVMGSGFFESGGDGLPSVLDGLVSDLRDAGRLTRSAGIHVVAQPDACQCLAAALASPAWKRSGWTAWAPLDPSAGTGTPRRLHAKFVLGANWRTGSDRMGDSWLYLGSGNLTGPGMTRKAGSRGNLEVGVVIDPAIGWSDVSARLPTGWGQATLTAVTTQPGDGLPDREPGWTPPIPYVQAAPSGDGLLLRPPAPADVELLGLDARPCAWAGDAWIWHGATPLDVEVRGAGGRARIPVLDAAGRVGGGPLTALAFDEALPLLLAFPDPPEPDELEDDEQDGPDSEPPGRAAGLALGGGGGAAGSAVRRMTALVEAVAALQCGLGPGAWLAWLVRLEQTLVRIADSAVVQAFRALELDPLPVLARPAFLPAHAQGPDRLQAYAALLERVRTAWGVDDFEPLIPEDA